MRVFLPTRAEYSAAALIFSPRGARANSEFAEVRNGHAGTTVAGVAVETPMDTASPLESKSIYWRRELPPLDAQSLGEYVVEASSHHVADTIAHRDELWNRCEEELMANARLRLREEIDRLGGRYAHVLHESIEPRHNTSSGEAWLSGRFTYMLYR